MKRFVFPYSISFGKLDSVEGSISCSLSDADAERLIRSAEEGGRNRLGEDVFISDISDKVYQAVNKKLTKQLLQDPTPVRDAFSWEDSYSSDMAIGIDQIQEYLDDLMITAYYPKRLQLLKPTITDAQSTVEYVIMSEAEAEEYIKKDSYENLTVILTDNGETLYHVPLKFSGKFVVPSTIRKIRSSFSKGAFYKREKITEIVIEEGLAELGECAFAGCKLLKKVVIPSSVKKIGPNVFSGCTSLEEVCLSEGLEVLENTAFRGCCKLRELKLPSTVKEISRYINCYNDPIRQFYFLGMNTEISDHSWEWDRVTMHVLPGSLAEKYAKKYKIQYELIV